MDMFILASGFDPLLNLFKPFFQDGYSFVQAVATVGCAFMVTYYKVREMFAPAQEDQMYEQKSRKALMALIFIYIVPTLIKVAGNYFNK